MHLAALDVLERVGVLVEDVGAMDILADGGCLVDRATHMVRIPGSVAKECLVSRLGLPGGGKKVIVGKDLLRIDL